MVTGTVRDTSVVDIPLMQWPSTHRKAGHEITSFLYTQKEVFNIKVNWIIESFSWKPWTTVNNTISQSLHLASHSCTHVQYYMYNTAFVVCEMWYIGYYIYRACLKMHSLATMTRVDVLQMIYAMNSIIIFTATHTKVMNAYTCA